MNQISHHCSVQSALSRFEVDLDHLLASLVQIPKQDTDKTCENHLNTSILLKHATELVPTIMVVACC